jgi:hypothetical protein
MVSSLKSTSHTYRKKFPTTLGSAGRWSAPQAHQRDSTPSHCTTGYITSQHTSCSRTLTQRQQRLSSQRTRIHGRSVATCMAGCASGGRWAGRSRWLRRRMWCQNNPGVADVGDDHEVPLLDDGQRGATTLDRVQAAAAPVGDLFSNAMN